MPTPRSRSTQADSYQLTTFLDKPRGINTVTPPALLGPNDCTVCQNWKLNHMGQLETREGLTRVTATPLAAAVKTIQQVPIGTGNYTFLVDADHKIHKLTGTAPTLAPGTALATLEGAASIVPFNGYAILLDGGYIKTTLGTTVNMAYDDGDGASGYTSNNTCATGDTSQDLYSGAKVRAAQKITTQAWTAGYTLPLTTISVELARVGSPTGAIACKLYDETGASVLDTSTTDLDAGDVTTNSYRYEFDFGATYGMSPSTVYMASIEFSGGDSSNYIKVVACTVSSGGLAYSYTGSTWSAATTMDIVLGVKPGRPPKGAFGEVKDSRIFVGGDASNLGLMYYSNTGSHLDWSTIDGGGYIGAVDSNANNFPIGAIIQHYGDLFILGRKNQPYLSKLTGATPTTWTLPLLFQETWTDHKSVQGVGNDFWFANSENVFALSGVQEYGDIRSKGVGDSVENILAANWTTDSFSGYNPVDGQFWWCPSGGSTVYVFHTKHPFEHNNRALYPVVTYVFRSLTPTAFGLVDGVMHVGCSDGHLYKLDSSVIADAGTAYVLEVKTGGTESPLGSILLHDAFMFFKSEAVATAYMSFYLNGATSATFSRQVARDVGTTQYRINAVCDAVQVGLATFVNTAKLTLQSIILKVRRLSKWGSGTVAGDGTTVTYSTLNTTGTATATGSVQTVDSFSDVLGGRCEWDWWVDDGSGNIVSGTLDMLWDATTNTYQDSEQDRQDPLGTEFSVTVAGDISSDTVRLRMTAPVGYTIHYTRTML